MSMSVSEFAPSGEHVFSEERTRIWLQERAAGYKELDWVDDRELLSPFLLQLTQDRVDDYVDLGTGTGAVLTQLAPLANRAVGVDISEKMLSQVDAATDNIFLLQADASRQVPLPTGYADLVTERMMLHDLEDPGQALREAWRIVKPGGQLIICENVVDLPNSDVANALHGFLNGQRINSPIGDSNFYHAPSEAAVAFLRSLFVLKHEPNRYLWTGGQLRDLVQDNCEEALSAKLLFSIKYWDVGNWLEKSGFPLEDCKQRGIAACLAAPANLKDEWGLNITVDGESVPLEHHPELLARYQEAAPDIREATGINAFFYAAFANISVTKAA